MTSCSPTRVSHVLVAGGSLGNKNKILKGNFFFSLSWSLYFAIFIIYWPNNTITMRLNTCESNGKTNKYTEMIKKC